jgi:DNA-binding MarR family transcriptional regulator
MTASPSATETATRVWAAMQAFVRAEDRRQELRDALDLGRGLGRVTALLHLVRGPLTLRDIAEVNGVDAPYATVIVDQLESRGLAQRSVHPDDHRRKLVTLTGAGREAAALAARILAEPPPALTLLAPGDLALLDAVLARLGPTPPSEAGRPD